MPEKVFLSAMAPPDMPRERRPWREQQSLSEEDFKVFEPRLKPPSLTDAILLHPDTAITMSCNERSMLYSSMMPTTSASHSRCLRVNQAFDWDTWQPESGHFGMMMAETH